MPENAENEDALHLWSPCKIDTSMVPRKACRDRSKALYVFILYFVTYLFARGILTPAPMPPAPARALHNSPLHECANGAQQRRQDKSTRIDAPLKLGYYLSLRPCPPSWARRGLVHGL